MIYLTLTHVWLYWTWTNGGYMIYLTVTHVWLYWTWNKVDI